MAPPLRFASGASAQRRASRVSLVLLALLALSRAQTVSDLIALTAPAGLAVSANGAFAFVVSPNASTPLILRVTVADGTSAVLAGGASSGAIDGVGAAASFSGPTAVSR